MKRLLLTVLCLGLLSTAGCYFDPAYGPPSVEVGVGAYTTEPYRYDAGYGRHRHWEPWMGRDRWYDRH
jgi:hypothetical protein